MKAIIFLYNFFTVLTSIVIFLCYFFVFEGKTRENGYFQNRINLMDETEKSQIKINKFSAKKISYLFLFVSFVLSFIPKKKWLFK